MAAAGVVGILVTDDSRFAVSGAHRVGRAVDKAQQVARVEGDC